MRYYLLRWLVVLLRWLVVLLRWLVMLLRCAVLLRTELLEELLRCDELPTLLLR